MSVLESYYETQAFEVVNKAIEAAVEAIALEKSCNLANIGHTIEFQDEGFKTPDIEWTACKNFTSDEGVKQIEEFVHTWKRDSAWLHCIDYLGEDDQPYDTRFKYRVRWSIPTRRKPIPRATACVYFTLYVSKIKPDTLPIEVYYVFEGNRLVHRPGRSRFREIWLKNIIESKVISMENVDF